MNKRIAIISIVSVVVIVGAGIAVYALTRPQSTTSDSMSGISKSSVSDESDITKSIVYQQYAALNGEKYDKNFLSNMIVHHQGAVDMAKLALVNAKHQELKDMAAGIIAAQEKEISNMTAWQKDWGYESTSTDSMMGGMSAMTEMLEGRSGDDFDKVFIEQMIMHHQSAIEMATPGANNAFHQEVKDLTRAVVSAQSGEIAQMKQWQKDWGYTS